MEASGYLKETEAADYLNRAPITLAKDRCERTLGIVFHIPSECVFNSWTFVPPRLPEYLSMFNRKLESSSLSHKIPLGFSWRTSARAYRFHEHSERRRSDRFHL